MGYDGPRLKALIQVGDARNESRTSCHTADLRERPRSNAYHFVPERDVARPAGAPCPIKSDGTSPYDRGRTLFLRLADRMRLFRTETRDFSDEELLAVKETAGQIYLDVSTKLAPDDFAKDLKKLVPSSECRRCEKRPVCTGAWEPLREDLFTRDDALLRGMVAALEGRVLDLGAGEGPYLDVLAPKIAAGNVEYTVIEPDVGRLDVLARRAPGATLVAAKAEELPEDLGLFDHVLVLRSYNHFASPDAVFRRAIGALRPGGTLLVADNVAFGLVRGLAHARRAERAETNAFEHYRNDGAEEAHGLLSRYPLELRDRRDVGPLTSNQWLLRYERTAGDLAS